MGSMWFSLIQVRYVRFSLCLNVVIVRNTLTVMDHLFLLPRQVAGKAIEYIIYLETKLWHYLLRFSVRNSILE